MTHTLPLSINGFSSNVKVNVIADDAIKYKNAAKRC